MTGPDEYSALADDNTYTNLMAAANLVEAAAAAGRWPAEAADLGVDDTEIADWRRAAEAMAVPHDDETGVPEQDRGSTRRQRWDFAASDQEGSYPLHEHVPYFDLYRKQVAKQADLVLALHWCGDRFTAAEKAAAFAYAEGLTVRDSSLSASTQAVVAAEVGQLELAHAYLREAALVDLQDRKGNTEDGLHMASLAGAWLGLVCGFGGLRDHGRRLQLRPASAQRHRPAGVRGVLAGRLRTGRRHAAIVCATTSTSDGRGGGDHPPRSARDVGPEPPRLADSRVGTRAPSRRPSRSAANRSP